MTTAFEQKTKFLDTSQYTWVVTGVAGFIGSHLLRYLLDHDQIVLGLDNFSTGYEDNLTQVQKTVSEEKFKRFTFHDVDVADAQKVESIFSGKIDFVLHQAALGSVPRSIEDPLNTNRVNVTGFLNVLNAAKEADVKSFVYASSSSVYGDNETLPKVEEEIGNPLSPYAASKYTDELYASVFSSLYGIPTTGLRYFNVFGPRQDPDGPYAAVIPRWIQNLLSGTPCQIFGDGKTSRDFCFIENVVQSNILSALRALDGDIDTDLSQVLNVAVGESLTLTELYDVLAKILQKEGVQGIAASPEYLDFRPGDIAHSLADLSNIKKLLGYEPTHSAARGLEETIKWFLQKKKV